MALESICGLDRIKLTKRDTNSLKREEYDARIPNHVLCPNFEPLKMKIAVAPVISPKDFIKTHFEEGKNKTFQFMKGTTTLAFIYEPATSSDEGGIVVSVDSRASSGIYVSSKTVMKILPITKYIVATMAGGAADCQFWIRLLAKRCQLYELENKERITVAAASKLLSNMLYSYQGMGLSIGTMITGFDKRGPSLYYVDNDGNRAKGEKFSIGSGSLNAYGILDTFYKPSMTDKEAVELGRKAIMHATYRDSGSGGGCNMIHITKDKGLKRLDRLDVSDMFYEFMEEKNRDFHEPANLLVQ